MNTNDTPAPSQPNRQDAVAKYLILGLIIIVTVMVIGYCASSSGPDTPPQPCPSDWYESNSVGDSFTDGFNQGLNNCE